MQPKRNQKFMKQFRSNILFIFLLLFMIACGGGAVNSPAGVAPEGTQSNTTPSVVVSSPTNGDSQIQGSNTNLTASANDAEDGDLSSNIQWISNIDGNLGVGANISVALSVGTHTITATIIDSNQRSDSDTINYSINPSSNGQPNINITSPDNGASQTLGGNTNLTATANDPEDGNISSNIQWSSNIDGSLGIGANINISLSAGNHTITATIFDSDEFSNSDSINYSVDVPPIISIASPTDGGYQPEDQTTLLQATANDTEDGNLNDFIDWSSDIDGALGTGNSLTVQLSTGAHLITASVTDSNNQSSSDSVNFVLVPSFGVATLSWTAPTENTDNTPLTDLVGFKIYYGTETANLTESIVIGDSNTVSRVIENLVNKQTYYFAVVAINALGIESEFSTIVSKLIDG